MPPTGQPYGRTALPTKTVEHAESVGLSEQMAQDYFRLGAGHRAEQDAQSLASVIQVPDTGGITGTTGYEGMLEPETSPPTNVDGIGESGDTSFADTRKLRQPMMAMPAAPELAPPPMRQPLTQQQGQAFDASLRSSAGLPGSQPTAPVDLSFPAATSSSAQAVPFPGGGGATASPPSPPPGGAIDNSSRQAFVTSAWPHMLAAAGGNRDAAEMMLAAAISENGSIGTGTPIWANNFFGIKGRGDAGSVTADTHEIVNGQRVDMPDAFAAYSSPTAGFRAFFDFLETNPRYERALGAYRQTGDAAQLFRDANTAGYATDPQWAEKVASIRRNQVAPIVAGLSTPAPSPTQRAAESRALAGETSAGSLDTAGITKTYQGVPYVFGGAGGRSTFQPGVASDCSGFVASVWKNQYGLDLAAHTDTSYNQLKALGATDVAESDARPGDVVYYLGAGTGGAITHHMGIYAGPGTVLDMSVSGGDGVRTRDIDHAGRHVILRDPRVNPTMPTQPLAPPSIVPSGDSGGTPVSHADAAALQLAALSDPSTSITSDAGAEDLRMAQAARQGYSDVSFGMGDQPQPSAAPPVRDDYRKDVVLPVDPDQGPRELGYSLPPEQPAVPPAQPGVLQGLWDAGAGAVGAVQGAAGAVSDAAGRAVQTVQDAYAVPTEQRPPQYNGPSYAQPTREQAGQEPVAPWAPIQTIGTTIADAAAASVDAADVALTGPALAAPTWGDPLAPVRGVGQHILEHPLSVLPAAIYGDIQGAGADVIGRRAGAAGGLSDVKEPYQTPLGTYELSQQDIAGLAAQIGLDPMNLVGVPGAAKARGLVRALVEAVPGIGELLAVGDIATAGVRAARARVGPAIGRALADNAQNVAAADARMAEQGSTAAPGVFGVSGIEPNRPEVQGMRPRVIPPNVADELDFPVRVPTDPSVVRAIEAAGGTVDERGTTLNVIRMSDPEAAGGAATRSMVFYTAGPPGAPSEYARTGTVGPQGVGGQQRIEGRTRFRNPLFISDAPGEARGFDDAMRQMAAPADRAAVEAAQADVHRAWAAVKALEGGPKPPRDAAFSEFQAAGRRLREAQSAPINAGTVEAGIAAAKRAGPAGSPERAQALKDLVSKYGGDPDVIDDLIALRGADMGESVYAVKENIVAGNARRAGHDGVITLREKPPDYQAIAAHPEVAAAQQRAREAGMRSGMAEKALREYEDSIEGRGGRYVPPSQDPERRPLVAAAQQARDDAHAAGAAAREVEARVRAELGGREITELADPREARNPTPGAPIARTDAEARFHAAKTAYDDALRAARGANPPQDAWQQADAARRDLFAARHEIAAGGKLGGPRQIGPPGYTLRSDIPRRPAPVAETANASAGALPASPSTDRLGAVNRVLGQGVASAVSGGVGAQVNQEMNPDDPYAGLKGFAAGALLPPLAQRGARGLARLAGAAEHGGGRGALATMGGLPPVDPDEIADLARRAAEQPVRGPRPEAKQTVKNVAGEIKRQSDAGIPPEHPKAPMPPPDPPPGWWDHAENWRYNVGLFGQIATGMVQAVGGGITAIGGGTAEAIRLAVLRGQGEALPLILGEGIKAVPGGVASSLRTAAGQVPKAIEAGSDYRPSLGARERAAGRPIRGAVADIVGTPGRVVTQAPDAFWHELFYRSGIAQAAADAARTEFGGGASIRGITGGVLGAGAGYETTPEDASPWERLARTAGGAILGGGVASLGPNSLARAQRTRELIANPTPEILAQAAKLAQDATYKGEPGALLGAPKRGGRAISEQIPSEAARKALGAAGSFLMPIYNTIARIHEEGLKIAPGVGMLPLERVGLGPKDAARGIDRRLAQQAVGLAFGASALGYAAAGGIRGPGPSNPNEAQAMRDQGYTTNTTNVAGFWVPNSWFGEYGPYLNEIGAINDARLYDHGDKSWDDLQWWQQGEALVKNSARAVRDYPALDAASTLTQLFTKPVDALTSLAGEVAAQYVPGPVRTAAMATDPATRTRTRGDEVPPEQRMEETFRQRSGIGREQLPTAQDILGRDVPNRRQGWAAVLPNVGQDRPDPIIQSYLDANLTIGDPPTRLSIPDLSPQYQSPELTPEETRRWNTLRGDAIIRTVGPLLDSPGWASATPEQRAAALEQRRTQAAAYAHRILRSEIGDADLKRRLDAARAGKRAS